MSDLALGVSVMSGGAWFRTSRAGGASEVVRCSVSRAEVMALSILLVVRVLPLGVGNLGLLGRVGPPRVFRFPARRG